MTKNFIKLPHYLLGTTVTNTLTPNEFLIISYILSNDADFKVVRSDVEKQTNIPSRTFDRAWSHLIKTGIIITVKKHFYSPIRRFSHSAVYALDLSMLKSNITNPKARQEILDILPLLDTNKLDRVRLEDTEDSLIQYDGMFANPYFTVPQELLKSVSDGAINAKEFLILASCSSHSGDHDIIRGRVQDIVGMKTRTFSGEWAKLVKKGLLNRVIKSITYENQEKTITSTYKLNLTSLKLKNNKLSENNKIETKHKSYYSIENELIIRNIKQEKKEEREMRAISKRLDRERAILRQDVKNADAKRKLMVAALPNHHEHMRILRNKINEKTTQPLKEGEKKKKPRIAISECNNFDYESGYFVL